jgi:flagellar basal body rod protein FlgG
LIYIQNFQRHRNLKISASDFTTKQGGMFYKFLIEFKVTRNFVQGKSGEVLNLTNFWLDKKKDNDIDGFATLLKSKGLTRNGTMTSLASKILFLSNPWEILPMDTQAKKTLKHTDDNLYKTFLPRVHKYRDEKSEFIKNSLTVLNPYLTTIEKKFKNELSNIKAIRENRFIDKLLWTEGL